ncbi:carboxymuconolactone decarboxylase family protein [Bradyrhizobium sp. SRS-191]|uniref:carboxymuconolactone decarboxylase family protein n=1 Tax=Bradyrhizobium sp. SRS-191 TaxID=2962606 RepID=UPI00211E3979|nr:carboxymuconolactone decarboxylase family protein [Bradyrhizobium sp. SRS-191]
MFNVAVYEFISSAHRSVLSSCRSHRIFKRAAASAIVYAVLLSSGLTVAGSAEKVDPTYKDVEQTLGKMPDFLRRVPKAALPGAWAEVKALQFSNATVLPPKVKALISLAVSAQIPCQHCIWEDTESAKRAGATQEEIGEAVAIAAVARHWSTMFHGLQVDFETFKKELGGDAPAAPPAK